MTHIIELISTALIAVAVLVIAITASAYVGWLTGAVVALLAGKVLGIGASIIASIFAWAYAGLTLVLTMIYAVFAHDG